MNRWQESFKIRAAYGLRGYGAYMFLVEVCAKSPTRLAAYDLGAFAYELREDEAFVRDIIERFGMFNVKDGQIEDVFNPGAEELARRREEQKTRNRQAAADRRRAAAAAKVEATVDPRLIRAREIWNEVFADAPTRQARTISAAAVKNFAEAFSDSEFRDAFARAKIDRFAWTFASAIKPDNIRLLLAKDATDVDNPKFTREQQEIYEEGLKRGWM